MDWETKLQHIRLIFVSNRIFCFKVFRVCRIMHTLIIFFYFPLQTLSYRVTI